MLEIGDRVRVKRTIRRDMLKDDAGHYHRTLESDVSNVEGIYLGWTARQTGIISPGREYGYADDTEPRYQEPYLTKTNTYRVYVIQPDGVPADRWRKPIFAFAEDVEAIDA